MKRLPILALICLAACLALWLAPRSGHAEIVDRIVAEVNDEVITMSELNDMAKTIEVPAGVNPKSKDAKALKREMLEALIDRKLAKAEAKKRGIVISDKDLNQAMNEFKRKNHIPDDDALAQGAAKMGMTVKELRQKVADQIQQERMMAVAVGAKKAEISDAEVRRFYDANVRNQGSGNQVHLQVVDMPFPPGATDAQKEEVKKKAESALKDIRLGTPVKEVQQKYSLNAQDLGFINPADLHRQLADILNKMRPGEVAPIQSPEGFQLVVLVGKRSGQAPSYEEAAPRIRQFLSTKTMEKQYMEWLKTLRAKAHIKIML